MIFIGGTRGRTQELGTVEFECKFCNSNLGKIISVQKWATFFFIPAFPVGQKSLFLECLACQNCFKIKEEHLNKLSDQKNDN